MQKFLQEIKDGESDSTINSSPVDPGNSPLQNPSTVDFNAVITKLMPHVFNEIGDKSLDQINLLETAKKLAPILELDLIEEQDTAANAD